MIFLSPALTERGGGGQDLGRTTVQKESVCVKPSTWVVLGGTEVGHQNGGQQVGHEREQHHPISLGMRKR